MRTQAALTAAAIRKILKGHGIQARVTSKNFSMGDSVTVRVVDQPPWVMKQMKEQLDCFEYGTFDGMTDCAGYKNGDVEGPQVKFLHITNELSDEKRQAIWAQYIETFANMEDAPALYVDAHNFRHERMQCYANEMMSRAYSDPEFWAKPKVRCAA